MVDDGSSDNTKEVVEGYLKRNARFQFKCRPIDTIKGASSCRNIGLNKANGAYVIFLDSDDILMPNCLENRVLCIKGKPECFFWVFPMKIQREDDISEVIIPSCENYLIEFLSCKIHWQTMCTFWDINFLKSINGFNALYPRLNDPEIHIKAMLIANSNYMVFNKMPPDSIYREAVIKDKKAYGLNYFKSLQLFIPDVAKKLIEKNRKEDIIFLRHYLNHYYQNFQVHTKRKNMLTLFRVFYKSRILSLIDYVYLHISYLLLLLFNLSSNKIKNKINSLLK